MFFGGAFSHAVRQVPAAGGIGMTEAEGATITSITPAPEVLVFGQEVLDLLGDPLCFRLDLVLGPEGPRIAETTTVDVELFFRHAPGAADRLIAALGCAEAE